MASVLKVTANGTSTSPITRGAWVLERILARRLPSRRPTSRPSSPTSAAPKSIREQLAKHRTIESCASCHAQIDPPGFALESFDVIGGWRDFYRLERWVKGAKSIKGQALPRRPAVDPTGELRTAASSRTSTSSSSCSCGRRTRSRGRWSDGS
jgi:hypothetical protein